MGFNIRRSLSVPLAPSSQPPPKSLQTTTGNTDEYSDRLPTTELSLLPAPVTAKDPLSRPRGNSKSVQISGDLRAYWTTFKKRLASGTAPSTSSTPDDSTAAGSNVCKPQGSAAGEQDGNVDVIVVDRMWGEDLKSSTKSDSNPPFDETRPSENKLGTSDTDHGSSEADNSCWASSPLLFFLRWRIWPPIWGFFRLRFVDQNVEAHYVKETWFLRKRLALFCAAFFVINWLLPITLITRPVTLADAIFYYGVGGPDGPVSIKPSLTRNRLAPQSQSPWFSW